MQIILWLVLFAAAFALPLVLRMFLEGIQGIAALVLIILFIADFQGLFAIVPFFMLWVLGSLAAAGLRSREAAMEAAEHHRLSYHDAGALTSEEERKEIAAAYLQQKYGRRFVIVKETYDWKDGRHRYKAHPSGEPGRTFPVRELRLETNGVRYTDDFDPEDGKAPVGGA